MEPFSDNSHRSIIKTLGKASTAEDVHNSLVVGTFYLVVDTACTPAIRLIGTITANLVEVV